MANSTSRFVIKFNSNIGRVLRLSIPRADMTMPAAAVQAAMEAIRNTDVVIVANSGTPVTINSAQRITTTRNTLINNAS